MKPWGANQFDPARRTALRLTAASAAWSLAPGLFAASDFWNRKPPAQWSDREIEQLTTHSPWAKEVNGDFMSDADYTTNGAEGPQIGRGGQIERPGADSSGQFQMGGDHPQMKHREPVTVRWESAQPIIDAGGTPLSPEFASRWVIGVTGLPVGIMERRGRGNPANARDDNSPLTLRRRMIEALSVGATLEARGKEPAGAGIVRAAPRTADTYLFGFSKDLLPLTAADREVVFILRTGLMEVKAKFELREMIYRGKLAL